MKKCIVLAVTVVGSAVAEFQRIIKPQNDASDIRSGNIRQRPFMDLTNKGCYNIPMENYENDQCVFPDFTL